MGTVVSCYKYGNRKHYVADALIATTEAQGFSCIASTKQLDSRVDVYYKDRYHNLLVIKTDFGVLTQDGLKNLATLTVHKKGIPKKYTDAVMKFEREVA